MISIEQTQAVSSEVVNAGLDYDVVTDLRQKFPEIHFTYCMDDDVSAGKPVIEEEKFNIYLVDGREHCLCLTNDHEVATGIVLAEIVEDDG